MGLCCRQLGVFAPRRADDWSCHDEASATASEFHGTGSWSLSAVPAAGWRGRLSQQGRSHDNSRERYHGNLSINTHIETDLAGLGE